MSHFDKASELLETPSEEDLLVNDLKERFGFDYDENDDPIIQTTLDDKPEEKSFALENINKLLGVPKSRIPDRGKSTVG